MKTLKELQERGTTYLCGYTDALKDFTEMLMDPKVYDPKHTGVLLMHIDAYVYSLMKEEMKDATK